MMKIGIYNLYYTVFGGELEDHSNHSLADPDSELLISSWNLPQSNPFLKKFFEFLGPGVETLQDLRLPRFDGYLSLQDIDYMIKNWDQGNGALGRRSKNSIFEEKERSRFAASPWVDKLRDWDYEELEKTDPKEKTQMKRHIRLTVISKSKIFTQGKNELNLKETRKTSGNLLLFIGGGGFIATFEKLQECFLRRWIQDLDCIIFELHYRLAPEARAPTPLNDVLQGYFAIRNYYEIVLGMEIKKLVLAGDSAGGNLACGLVNYLVMAQQPLPDSLLLMYPGKKKIKNSCGFEPMEIYAFVDVFYG